MSEAANVLREQAERELSAQQGLSGLARGANHDRIEERMKSAADRILTLLQAGKHEANRRIFSANWG